MNSWPRPPTLEEIDREIGRKSLVDWIPYLSPKYAAPLHLRPVVERLEAMVRGEPQRIVVHTPPRHGKTETLLHFIPWALEKRPDWTVSYCSYSAGIAYSKSRTAISLADAAGLQLASRNVSEWRTPERGGCIATGVGGPLTGYGLNIAIVDDPVKNRLEAESATYRERLWDWFRDVVMTRVEPGGSVIVNMARWHPDDLAGRLIDKGWEYICLPAISETREALWPERWPVEALDARKEDVGPYSWESLFQGQPRPRGGTVFGDPWGYDALPQNYRPGIGLDFAFTKKTSSDWSVLVVMYYAEGYFYVVDVVRVQQRAPEFKELVQSYRARFPQARLRWVAGGTEVGVADFIRDSGIPIETLTAKGDKFTRAIPYAASWNAGRVLVPSDSDRHPWVNQFLAEHASFTGNNDPHDDQVDAAGTCHDLLASTSTSFYDGLPELNSPRRM